MFNWLFRRYENDLSDNLDRWGFLGTVLLALIGAVLMFIAAFMMSDSDSNLVWRLVVGGLGFLIFGLGVGFRWLYVFLP